MVGSGLVTQRRVGRSRTERAGLEVEFKPSFAGPRKNPDRESMLVSMDARELMRRGSKIIWDTVPVQLTT